jgi:hypothetical protein
MPSRAQTTIEIGPLVGYYRPFGHFDPASVYAASLPTTPSDLRASTWGGTARVSFNRRVGVEGQLSVANSTVPGVNTPAGPREPTRAQLLMVMVQGQYDVSPIPEQFRVLLGAGPALIRHGGDAYAHFGSPVSPGGAIGVGVTLPMVLGLQLTAGASALFYPFDVKMPPNVDTPNGQASEGSFQHGFQTDALFHLGLRWGR